MRDLRDGDPLTIPQPPDLRSQRVDDRAPSRVPLARVPSHGDVHRVVDRPRSRDDAEVFLLERPSDPRTYPGQAASAASAASARDMNSSVPSEK